MNSKDLQAIAGWAVPKMDIPRPVIPKSAAEWTYERLGKLVKQFEAELDDEHEIGAGIVCFGVSTEFHIRSIGYWGPDIITFHGVNAQGERVELIQNVSQLSVLLVAMKKLGDKPRRIGFLWEDGAKAKANSDATPSGTEAPSASGT
jgi:hypothetical protein